MNVFELEAVVRLTMDKYKEDLDKAEAETKKTSLNLGNALKSFAKVGVAAFTAQTTAASFLAKEVVGAYGSYEQLVGGVEKLFGQESSQAVIKNAENAYKTAGMSANQYMETVTNFSASLINSLEGDTKAAVEYADTAIRDMSDNANTFGTDIASIQAAYQGFSKQNYTMLDNLKLGYGGTKTEMERLIKDANDLKVAQGGVADLTIERYSDIVEAIHLVQEEMNISGTTAKEAAGTVEGSLNSIKGAIANLWTELGKSNGNVRSSTQTIIKSFKTLLSNITPIIQNIAKQIPEIFDEIIKELPNILPAITDILNSIIDIGFEVAEGFIKALPSILAEIPKLIKNIAQNIIELIQDIDWIDLIASIGEGILGIVGSIGESILRIIFPAANAWYAHKDAMAALYEEGEKIYEQAQRLGEQRVNTYANLEAEIKLMEDIKSKLIEYTDEQGHVKEGYEDEMIALANLAEAQGIHIEVVDGEVQGYSDLVDSIDEAIRKRKEEAITAAETDIYKNAYTERRKLEGDYQTHYNNFLKNLQLSDQAYAEGRTYEAQQYKYAAEEELAAAEALKDGIVEYTGQMELATYNMEQAATGNLDDLAVSFDDAGIAVEDYYKDIDTTNSKIIKNYEQTYGVDIPKAIEDGKYEQHKAITDMLDTIKNAGYDGAVEIGWGVNDGFVKGLQDTKWKVQQEATHVMTSAINAAKREAGIKSPSKVFAWMGEMMTEGLAGGLEDGSQKTVKAAQDMVKEINNTMTGLNDTYDFNGGDPLSIELSNTGLRSNGRETTSETLLSSIASHLDNFEQEMYDALSRVLMDGFDLRWNDRELTRLVKEHV